MTDYNDPDYVPHFIAAYGIFRRGDTYLFMRRCNTNYRNGYYGIPAGRVSEGEPINLTILREVKEETGLDVHADDVKLVHVNHRHEPGQGNYANWVDFFYLIEKWNGEPVIAEPDKADDLKWLTLDSDEQIIPYLRDIIRDIEQNKFFSLSGTWPDQQQAA